MKVAELVNVMNISKSYPVQRQFQLLDTKVIEFIQKVLLGVHRHPSEMVGYPRDKSDDPSRRHLRIL